MNDGTDDVDPLPDSYFRQIDENTLKFNFREDINDSTCLIFVRQPKVEILVYVVRRPLQVQRKHHVGLFPELEEQLCEWSPEDSGKSPDRLDALVWLVTVLLEKGRVCRSSYMPEFFGRESDHMTNWQERPPVFGNGWER